MSHQVWSFSRSVCSGWSWNNDCFCWGFFGWCFFCFFTKLYGLSQQEILKNRSVKPQELESQMMTVQRGSSISVEDMWNSFRGGTTSGAWFSVQIPPVADLFRSGNCAGCQGQTNISRGGGQHWWAFSGGFLQLKGATTTTSTASLTTTLPRPLPPPKPYCIL